MLMLEKKSIWETDPSFQKRLHKEEKIKAEVTEGNNKDYHRNQ